jgi:hypothetical protein
MCPIADSHSERDGSPDRRGSADYQVEDERAAALGMGSGDVELEAAITQMRGSIIRTVTELDRFCMSIRRARVRVEAIAPDHGDTAPQ